MSEILNSPSGQLAIRAAIRDQVLRRMRRWFKRNTVIAFEDWIEANKIPDSLDYQTVVADLNLEHDQEILDLFELLQRIETDASTIDIDFYIDAANGDDETGDGSIDAPFASLTRVQRMLPSTIRGNVNIFVSAPTATPITAMDNWELKIEGAGQLTIQGNDPDVVISGPHTINAWGNLIAAGACGHTLAVAAPTWVANEVQGMFVHMLDGAESGKYYAIAENDASTLYIGRTNSPPAGGDTFEIVRPGTVIAVDGGFGSTRVDIKGIPTVGPQAQFCLTGIRFLSLFHLNIKDIYVYTSFVEMYVLNMDGDWSLNQSGPLVPAEIQNADLQINEYQNTFIFGVTMLGNNVQMRWVSVLFTSLVCNNATIRNAAVKSIHNYSSGSHYLNVLLLLTVTAGNQYTSYTGSPAVRIYDVYNLACTTFLNANTGHYDAQNIAGTAPTNYTVSLGSGAIFEYSPAIINGAVNDIYWQSTLAAAAFPGAPNTGVSDGVGAWVIQT